MYISEASADSVSRINHNLNNFHLNDHKSRPDHPNNSNNPNNPNSSARSPNSRPINPNSPSSPLIRSDSPDSPNSLNRLDAFEQETGLSISLSLIKQNLHHIINKPKLQGTHQEISIEPEALVYMSAVIILK